MNLEWVTQLENLEHEFLNKGVERHTSDLEQQYIKNKGWGSGALTYGENNGMSKWNENIVHSICINVQNGSSYAEALELTGLENTPNNRYNVSHIIRGHRWKHISSQYNFN